MDNYRVASGGHHDDVPDHVGRQRLMPALVDSLNQLLRSLGLPFVLESPTDLTPTLLLAILASLLRTPLLTESQLPDLYDTTLADISQASDDPRSSQVKQMKLLIGVLRNDVLDTDVGLSEIDPRRLARGERVEVEFVGELFVWLGKKLGHLPGESKSQPAIRPNVAGHSGRHDQGSNYKGKMKSTSRRPPSPSCTATTTNESVNPTDLSMHSFTPSVYADTITSLPSSFATSLRTAPPYPRPSQVVPSTGSPRNGYLPGEGILHALGSSPGAAPIFRRPRCIHELEVNLDLGCPLHQSQQPSEFTSPPTILPDIEFTTCHCSFSSRPHLRPLTPMQLPPGADTSLPGLSTFEVPVRYEGYISPVDEEAEIASFEASRSFLSSVEASDNPSFDHEELPPCRKINGHFAYEVKLLEERARLLGEMALASQRLIG